jgi:hypothetical protein
MYKKYPVFKTRACAGRREARKSVINSRGKSFFIGRNVKGTFISMTPYVGHDPV